MKSFFAGIIVTRRKEVLKKGRASKKGGGGLCSTRASNIRPLFTFQYLFYIFCCTIFLILFAPPLPLLSFRRDLDDEDDDKDVYNEGLGDSLSSIGFRELKLGMGRSDDSNNNNASGQSIPQDNQMDEELMQTAPSSAMPVPPLSLSLAPHFDDARQQQQQQQQQLLLLTPPPQQLYAVPAFRSNSFPGAQKPQRRSERTPFVDTASHNRPEQHAVQTHDVNGQKIKRPMNAYMLWLQANRKSCPKTPQGKSGLTHEAEKCASLGERWKMLDEDEKAMWFTKATEAKKKHQKDYPTWKYTPRSPKSSKKQKRATAPGTRSGSPAGKTATKRMSKKSSRGSIIPSLSFELDFDSEYSSSGSGRSSSSSSSSSSLNSQDCDGLLVPLTPFFEGQEMHTFESFAAEFDDDDLNDLLKSF